MNIRVLLAEDHVLVRQALRALLSAEADIEVVGEASTGTDVLPLLTASGANLLVLDIGLPELNGVEVMRRVRRDHGRLPTLALSAYLDAGFLQQMLDAGADGFVHKGGDMDELIRGIRVVAAGSSYLCRNATELKATMVATEKAEEPRLGRREREVLALVAKGWRSQDIGEELDISVGTVDVHRRNIMRKLNLHSVADLTRYSVRIGLVGDD